MSDDSLLTRIVNLRESQNWSQIKLGKKLNLDKSTMNKIENGTRRVSTDELEKSLISSTSLPIIYWEGKTKNMNSRKVRAK
ncbi:helix-turn-helix domain-containing protein [Tetragenococcus halophilus]|uniref:helix-turn-helix domain-containing protein n=1 Tax=Tetragenococcus halophilus TaxID=51669 RepID=UPI001B6A0058|nr:helix-turn-helix transcriptional regulator [Tetragenococcus halophilus]GFK29133.1 hypothetical protein YG2_15670 [Tetragenococcus halophilus]GLL51603.1 hypothetical protein YA5_015800 [Tetragenococcus halophilus]